jgi:hypothetical protein
MTTRIAPHHPTGRRISDERPPSTLAFRGLLRHPPGVAAYRGGPGHLVRPSSDEPVTVAAAEDRPVVEASRSWFSSSAAGRRRTRGATSCTGAPGPDRPVDPIGAQRRAGWPSRRTPARPRPYPRVSPPMPHRAVLGRTCRRWTRGRLRRLVRWRRPTQRAPGELGCCALVSSPRRPGFALLPKRTGPAPSTSAVSRTARPRPPAPARRARRPRRRYLRWPVSLEAFAHRNTHPPRACDGAAGRGRGVFTPGHAVEGTRSWSADGCRALRGRAPLAS